MSTELSTLVPREVTAAVLASAVRGANGVPPGVALDPALGAGLDCGPHPWTVLLARGARGDPLALARRPGVVAVVAHTPRETGRLQVRFVVELRPRGTGHEVVVRTAAGWRWATGTAQLGADGVDFAIPLRLPRATGEGRIAGRLSPDGVLTLSDARVPTPATRIALEPNPA